MWIVTCVCVCIQVFIIIYYWGKPQYSDWGSYIKIAEICFEKGAWYPMREHISDAYIWTPGFINFLILQLKLFGTVNYNMVFNLFWNIGIWIEIYFLGKRFFNERTACFSVIGYCLLYSNIMIVAPAGTELPFLFLALSAFCLCFSLNIGYLFGAGILFALANWIRPLSPVFIIAILIYMIFQHYKLKHYCFLFLGVCLTVMVLGMTSQKNMGYFIFQSTTSGFNLIQTANDKAYGGVAVALSKDTTSTVYIRDADKYTFEQKDSIWKKRALEWIWLHPMKYTQLYFLKLGGLYVEDSWSERPLSNEKTIGGNVIHGTISSSYIWDQICNRGMKSIIYYIIIFMFVYSVIVNFHQLFSSKGVIFLVWLLGTLSTCLFPVAPRYHYPFLFVMVILAAYGMDTYLKRKHK